MSQEERERMDKKYGRQSSVPPKGNGTDSSKKDNGNNNNQKFPRHNRYKDNGNKAYDQQPSGGRRSQPPKARYMDKRPRPRGVHNGGGRDTVTDAERTEPEYGSVQSWGPKKNNLSHLLNFHFEPRDFHGNNRGGGSRGTYRGKGRQTYSRGPRFNKEHFLQANFQFIVKDSGDYTAHAVDPDVLVDWDLIEQIRIQSPGQTACPICLYPPKAAKITRCGHIYCWSCILHYLSLGEKAWRRCPICYDAILQKDLKSVKIIETHNYCVGETITLKLMKRMKGSTQAMPIDQWTDREGKLYNLSDGVDTQYAKLLVVSSDEVLQMLLAERKELEQQLKEEGSETLEGSYIKAALEHLEQRQMTSTITSELKEDIDKQMEKLKLEETKKITEAVTRTAKRQVTYSSAFSDEELEEPPVSDVDPESATESRCVFIKDDPCESIEGSERSVSESSADSGPTVPDDEGPHPGQLSSESVDDSAHDENTATLDDEAQGMSTSAATEVLSIPQDNGGNGATPKRNFNYFYFFQATDGQNIYLHSVNAQCLIKEYGCLENCPQTITAKIVELQGVTMNEELRQRLRYLGHIPVTCEFQVAELALKPPIVSAETLQFFSDKIEKKKRQRQKKSREEKRISRRIQEEENKKMGIDPRAVIVKSDTAFVRTYEVSTGTTGSVESTPGGSPIGIVPSDADILATSPRSTTSSDEGGQGSMSFAQMLKAGKAKPQEAWPKAGITQTSDQSAPRRRKGSASDDSDNEDRTPVPGYKDSFGDAIQKALDNYQGPGSEVGETVPAVGSQNVTPTKKKKKVKMLLFSTTMNRAK